MKRFFALSISSAVIALAAGTAFAGSPAAVTQEAPVHAAAALTYGNDWTGGYVGLAVSQHEGELSTPLVSLTGSDSGVGIFAGYDHDMGQYVLGVELSYDPARKNGDEIKLTRLKGRLGYDAGQWMLYATLGLAKIEYKSLGFSESDSGVSFGLGVDYAVSKNFVLGAELTRSSVNNLGGMEMDVDTIQIRGSWKF